MNHVSLSLWEIGPTLARGCSGNKGRQLQRRRRQETERGGGGESVGGVEPKEMDNWINVEAAAIPSLFPPSFFLFVLCDTCSVEGFGFPPHKSQEGRGVNCTTNQSYRVVS